MAKIRTMKHFLWHTINCFLSCGAFHLLDAKFSFTGRIIQFLINHGVW